VHVQGDATPQYSRNAPWLHAWPSGGSPGLETFPPCMSSICLSQLCRRCIMSSEDELSRTVLHAVCGSEGENRRMRHPDIVLYGEDERARLAGEGEGDMGLHQYGRIDKEVQG